ncbi:Kynureninase [Carbonactinospora thermoautotrophica]|uniref:Kynureninase n=1 Tax=Carbonactinospora thermoautotrophica TaxID=1469144 RepID=A0A132MQZ6_9ACTN|nr:kynureninase [Carbonactinospora thermoautotrophica]KWW99811.1 Kynureninase [Carbonactinospora thermoautotrophica]
MTQDVTNRDHALALDEQDPLRELRDEFVIDSPDVIYLDGNSLGRLPQATRRRLDQVIGEEWGRDLITSWERWIDRPYQVGDLIAEHLLGARPGEVVVSDSTSVNLYKLASAALDARPGRRAIVTDDDNFPTDRYILQGIAAQRGLELRVLASDPIHGPSPADVAAVLDSDVALVCFSHVAYRSGALLDMAAITRLAHDAGALMLWDLCHSAGSVPVRLEACGVDLAVGCTYKYLNAGPGAPAFLYVRRELQDRLRSPIWGWFGQRDQFAMGLEYDPVPGVGRFQVGTPPILGVSAVEEGVRLLARAGIDQLRAKGVALTDYLIRLADAWLAPLGFEVATPRDPQRRGSHVSLAHPEAYRICRAWIERYRVIPDFRAPDRLRIGPAPIYTRFVEVYDALDRLRRLVENKEYAEYDATPARVT